MEWMDHIYIVAAVIIYLYKSTGRIQKKDLIKLILKYFKTDKIPIFIIKKREEMNLFFFRTKEKASENYFKRLFVFLNYYHFITKRLKNLLKVSV